VTGELSLRFDRVANAANYSVELATDADGTKADLQCGKADLQSKTSHVKSVKADLVLRKTHVQCGFASRFALKASRFAIKANVFALKASRFDVETNRFLSETPCSNGETPESNVRWLAGRRDGLLAHHADQFLGNRCHMSEVRSQRTGDGKRSACPTTAVNAQRPMKSEERSGKRKTTPSFELPASCSVIGTYCPTSGSR
jgi:hypothetical protein